MLTTAIIARLIDGMVFSLLAGLVAMAGRLPQVEGKPELGLAVAGALNFVLLGILL